MHRISTKALNMTDYSRMKKSELILEISQLNKKLNELTDKINSSSAGNAEMRYKTIADNLNVGLYRSEAKNTGKILESNPAFLNMFGFSSFDELKHLRADDLYLNPEDRKSFLQILFKKGLVKNKEVWFKRKNGSMFLGSLSTLLISDGDNKPLYFDGIIEDITERKKAIVDLTLREEQYRTLFNLSPDGIVIMDENGNLIDANPAYCELLGYPFSEIIDSNISDLAHDDVKKQIKSNIAKILSGERLKHVVKNKSKKNNRETFINLNEGKIILPDGRPGILSIAEDITDRIQTEEKLKEREQLYRLLVENQSDFIVKVDTQGRFLFVSPSYCDFFGKTEEELLGREFMILVHQDDQSETNKAMKNLYKPPYKAYLEQRAMTNHGWRWVSWMDTAVLNEKNKVVEIIGVGRDITERKLAEQSLLQSEESYRGLFNSVTDAIYLQDQEGRFVDVNSGAEKMYGYPREYFIGKLPDFLSAPGMNDFEKVAGYIKEAFNGYPQTFEFWGIDKNKRIFPKEVRINKSSYFGKEVVVAFAHDISQRIADQQLLIEKEKKLRQIFNAFPDIYFKSNNKGVVLEISPSVEKITGFKPEEVIGRDSKVFYYSVDDFKTIADQFKISEEIRDFDTRLRTKSGGFIECSLTASLIVDENSGEPIEIQGVLHDISERVRAEQVIRENERRLSTLLANLPGMAYQCLYDEQWTMKFVSNGCLNLTGYAAEDLIDNYKLAYADLIHPDDQGQVYQKVTEAIDQKQSFTLIYRIKTKSNQEKWVWEKGVGVFSEEDGRFSLEGFITDITDQIKAEEEVRKLSRAVEQSPNIVIMTDLDARIQYVNRQFEKTSGYTAEEVIGKNPRILKSGYTGPEVYKKLWSNLSVGKEWHGEFKNRTKNGEIYWESANIFPLKDDQGKTTHYIGMKEDITFRKKMEIELVAAKEKAEESDKLKSAFLANMSHEIRTPMNAIIGFSQLLNEGGISEEERAHYINLIQNSGNDLMALIDDIIDISKIEAGQMKIFKSQYILDNLLLELYENFRQILKTQPAKTVLELRYLPPENADKVFIHTDVDRFKQIFRNLLNNAIKFTDFGSVEFGFSIKKEEQSPYLEFFVTDTGIGIPIDKKEIIFESFTQANDSESRLYGGTGLGLAITKKIVEILGGKIWVESKRGHGSTFYFTLPEFSFKPGEKFFNEIKNSSKDNFTNFSGKTLLIIDSNFTNLTFIQKVLNRTKCNLLQTVDYNKSLKIYEENMVDLVVIDISNTQNEGFKAILKLREKDKTLPIIALSSYTIESEKQKCLSIGCNDYLSKPIDISAFLSTIEKHLMR